MPTIHPGNPYTNTLRPGATLTLVAPVGGMALVERVIAPGVVDKTTVSAGAICVYGPYLGTCPVRVTAFAQPCVATLGTSDAPATSAVPFTIAGSYTVGGTATVTPGPGWATTGSNVGQWYMDGVAVSGATLYTYTFQAGDAGKLPTFKPVNLPFTVTGSVVPALPVVLPVIATPTSVGVASVFSPAAASQQWALDGIDQAGATASTYTQALPDSAKVLTVRTPAGTSAGAIPGMQNWKASNTANWRAMRDAQLSGSPVNGNIVALGDSYPAGHGSGNTTVSTPAVNARAKSWPSLMADNLIAAGLPVNKMTATGATQGLAGDGASYPTLDPRWSALGAPTRAYGGDTFGGLTQQFTAAGMGMTFTPGGTFDTVDILYFRNGGGAGLKVSLDGGATTFAVLPTSQVGGAAGTAFTTLAVPSGSTAITFMYNGSTVMNPPSVVCRNAASPGIRYLNGAVSQQRISYLNHATPASSVLSYQIANYAPKLFDPANGKNIFFINGWYNDRSQFGDAYLEEMKTVFRELYTILKPLGDVVYCGYADLSGATAFERTWQDAMLAVAIQEFDLPVFDCSRVVTSYATNTSLYFDGLHLGPAGQPYPGASMARQLLAI